MAYWSTLKNMLNFLNVDSGTKIKQSRLKMALVDNHRKGFLLFSFIRETAKSTNNY